MPNIVLCYPALSHHLDWIRQALPSDWQLIDAGQEGIAEAILEADVFCGHAKVPVPWPKVVAQGRLKWIQSSAAGLDHCLTKEVIDSGIAVSSSSGLFANQVAEQTLALLFGWYRQIPLFVRLGQQKRFERHPTFDVHGKTIGIIGLGGNGRRIGELLAPLGNTILATDWFPDDKPDYVSELLPPDQLHEVLASCDIVILGVPLNSTTHHLIDASALEQMRPGSVLVNVARGPVVDEVALIESLRAGHLAGAALDVTETEPLSTDSPLWQMNNVLITPHVGAQSSSRVDDSTKLFCLNFKRWLESKPLMNQVDKPLGFPHPSRRIPLSVMREKWEQEFGARAN